MERDPPARIGPYDVVELMGEGGTGRVFRCTHRETKQLAAVKVPKTMAPREREALRRETVTLSRLGRYQHPGVVKLLEWGSDGPLCYYAMEFVHGEDLAAFCQELWTGRAPSWLPVSGEVPTESIEASGIRDTIQHAPVERHAGRGTAIAPIAASERHPVAAGQLRLVLEIAAQVADALDLVHSEGVVHGDLTPRNILIRQSDSLPVLVDFGTSFVAHQAGVSRELAHASSGIGGTPAYLAPERIERFSIDARSDLYALGCILYELLASRRPFTGRSVSELVVQHQHTRPLPPSAYVQDVPSALDSLVMRLLAKNPVDRLGQAREVALILRELLGEDTSSLQRTKALGVHLYRPRLAGREGAYDKVWQRVLRAKSGTGGLAFIGGTSGIGKTRLANEVGIRAAAHGLQVVSSHCTESNSAVGGVRGTGLHAFRPLLERVADYCLSPLGRDLFVELAPSLTVLKPYAAGALGELDLQGEPAAISADLAKERVLRSLASVLGSFARIEPLLLIVDDLQWGDELSLQVLRTLQPQLNELPLVVLGTYRSEETAEGFEAIRATADVDIALSQLSRIAAQSAVKDMLGTDVIPEGLVAFLYRHSEGIPFFLAEYLRAALDRGWLSRSATGTLLFEPQEDLVIPRSLDELLALRVARLSEKAASTLQLAAILGREFDVDLLESMPDAESLTDPEALEELVGRQILEWVGAGRYRFVHDKLREAQEQALSARERKNLHRLAAERLAERYAPEHPDLAAQLGVHWAHADEPERALPHLERAAAMAEATYARSRAIDLFALAVQQCELLQRRAPEAYRSRLAGLHEALGDALVVEAQHGRARAAYHNALALLRSYERLARARVHRKLAASHWTLHEYQAAEESHNHARKALGEPNREVRAEVHEYIEILTSIVEQLYFARKGGAETEQLLSELEPLINQYGTAAQACRYYVRSAADLFQRRRYRFSEEVVRQAKLALTKEGEAPLNQTALARLLIGFALNAGDRSHNEEALGWLQDGEREARAAGDSTLLSRLLVYQGLANLRLQRVAEVASCAEQAMAVAESVQQPPYVAAATAYLAWVAWHQARPAEALTLAEKAKQIWHEHPHAFPFEWVASFPLLDMYAVAERFADAKALLEHLLDPQQQELPEDLTDAIRQALSACGTAEKRPRDAAQALKTMLQLARASRYL